MRHHAIHEYKGLMSLLSERVVLVAGRQKKPSITGRLSVGVASLRTTFIVSLSAVLLLCSCPVAAGQDEPRLTVSLGIGGIWCLVNFSFVGMRAQASTAVGWKIAAFLFGFPGTLLTYLVVRKGSERAYGVDLPKRRGPGDAVSQRDS